MPGSENPFLAIPYGFEATIEVSVEACGEPRGSVEAPWPGVAELGGRAASRLAGGLGLCVDARVSGVPGWASRAGVYAAATAAAAYAVARWYGERPSTEEVMEAARLADPEWGDASWASVVDALRYASLEGSVAVYRNEEEKAVLPGRPADAAVEAVEPAGPAPSREQLGLDVYNALVHLAGSAALAAAVASRDEGDPLRAALRLARVSWALAYAVWGVKPREGCIPSPGLESIEVACPRPGGRGV